VVATPELPGAFDRHHILALLHHTDGRGVALGVAADAADVLIGDVETDLAETHLLLDLDQRLGEAFNVLGGLVEQPEGDALSTLRADPGQASQFIDQVLDGTVVQLTQASQNPRPPRSGINACA